MTVLAPSHLEEADMYALHLAGGRVRVEGDVWPQAELGDWFRESLPGDDGLLDRCTGPTLDVGCGPGRLSAALARRRIASLGIDVSPVAVWLTRAKGAGALQRDVHQDVPGAGRWHHILLADGNIGIGGDPVELLRRCRDLLAPTGSVVVDVSPGNGVHSGRVRWSCGQLSGDWFDWSRVGIGALGQIAADAGLFIAAQWDSAGRLQAELAVDR